MEFGNFGQRLIRVDQGMGIGIRSVTADDCGSSSTVGSAGVLPAGLFGATKLVITSCR